MARRDHYQAAAHRGAVFLDRKLGRGWRRKIRRRELDMSVGRYSGPGDCGCVLAQLYGGYARGLEAFGISLWGDEDKEERLGFASYGEGQWDALTEAWKEELRRG